MWPSTESASSRAAGAEHSDPAERAGDARRPLERDAVLLALEQVASGDLLGNFREQRGQAAGGLRCSRSVP